MIQWLQQYWKNGRQYWKQYWKSGRRKPTNSDIFLKHALHCRE